MAGKHRKISRPAAVVAAVVAPGGIAAAALAVSGFSPGGAPSPSETPTPSVGLAALITPSNSTAQIFAGTTYYGTDYTKPTNNPPYGPQQVVPFFRGPDGIATAIKAAGEDPKGTVVLASGWGAGQTGTALGDLKASKDPALKNIKLVILDNNTNRAGGGFWTTYAPFAPLLGTSAAPTPSDTGAVTLDVAYEYNINSNAPVDPLNPFALGNSLAAYAYGYGAEQNTQLPQEVQKEIADAQAAQADPTKGPVPRHAYVVKADGTIDADKTKEVSGTTTYVTYESDNLPLTRPLRLLPGGDILADTIDPTMTQLVNAGYSDTKGFQGDEAIPQDPTVTRPMKPGSSLSALDAGALQESVQEGASDGAQTAIRDVSEPTKFVSKPLKEAGKLPIISSLSPSTQTKSTVARSNTLSASRPNFFAPVLPGTNNKKTSSGSTSTGGNALKSFTDQVSDTVKKVTGGLKPASKDTGDSE